MLTPEIHHVDKSSWPPGPWHDEGADREDWVHLGYPCFVRRHDEHGNWCGYVAVAHGHPYYGFHYESPEVQSILVHRGMTYSAACSGHICHVPQPGEPDDVWWFGFDCGHGAVDMLPGMVAMLSVLGRDVGSLFRGTRYRTKVYAIGQCKLVAEQLARLVQP